MVMLMAMNGDNEEDDKHDENSRNTPKYMSRSCVGQKVPGGHVQTYKQVLEKV